MWGMLRLWQRWHAAIFLLLCGFLGVGVVEFIWPSVAHLAESELLVLCVEVSNEDSGWALYVGLPLSGLF
jgi:hypothetical protein